MNEGEFWNNLDSLVDKKNPISKDAGKKEIERVGTWLKEISELDEGTKSSLKNQQRYAGDCDMTITKFHTNKKLSIAHKQEQLETCAIKKNSDCCYSMEGISIACNIRKKSKKRNCVKCFL
jgi:hypothetical protein